MSVSKNMEVKIMSETPLRTEAEAAKILNVSQKTLQAWRWRNQGPAYYKLGKGKRGAIRYPQDGLISFLEQSKR